MQTPSPRNSEFNLIEWTPGTLEGRNVLANIANCRNAEGRGARFNLGGQCNSRVDHLAVSVLAESDSVHRVAMSTEAFRIIHDDVEFIPLHQQASHGHCLRKSMPKLVWTIRSAPI